MIKGQVINVSSNHILVEDDQNQRFTCLLRGRFKQDYKRNSNFVKVGDFVEVLFENDQHTIENVLPRTSKLSRTHSHYKEHEQVIAANVDQIIMVAAFVEPDIKTGLIDRYTAIAEQNDLTLIICLNKADLVDIEKYHRIINVYEKIGYDVIILSTITELGKERLIEKMTNKLSVITGHSGVGKSSILNMVEANFKLKTEVISAYTGKGQHITTTATLYRLSFNASVIDTPGIRELGLWDFDPQELHLFFREFKPFSDNCKFYNCTHQHEPGCKLLRAVDLGKVAEFRYKNYLYMMEELEEKSR